MLAWATAPPEVSAWTSKASPAAASKASLMEAFGHLVCEKRRPRPKPGAVTAAEGWSEGFLCVSRVAGAGAAAAPGGAGGQTSRRGRCAVEGAGCALGWGWAGSSRSSKPWVRPSPTGASASKSRSRSYEPRRRTCTMATGMRCWSSSWPCSSSAAAVWEALWGRRRSSRHAGTPLESRSGADRTAQPFSSQLRRRQRRLWSDLPAPSNSNGCGPRAPTPASIA